MAVRPSLLLALGLLGATPGLGFTPHLVKDINPVPIAQGSVPQGYATAGGLAFFAANDGLSGAELWRSDGTEAGTFQLADACPGDCSGSPVIVARTEQRVFFRAFGRSFGPVDLWVTDGSPAGTVRLATTLLIPDSGRRRVWIAGQGLLYFVADDLDHGAELWRSDGTPAGTFQVTDLRPGFSSSQPDELTAVDGRLFFRADDGVRGPALWTSDGTAAGTRLVRDPLPNRASHGGPSLLRAVGRTLYFTAPVTSRRDGLWKSDGTTAGTSSLIDFPSSTAAPAFRDATVLGNRVLFVASEPQRGAELWASDGTKKGTLALTRLSPASPFLPLGTSTSRLLPEKSLGGRMVFRVDDGGHGAEPWTTDGTAAGTGLLRDLCPGPCRGAGSVDDAGWVSLASGNRLLFSGNNGVRGFELWTTDGTAAGTRLVRDLCRGGCSSEPFALNAGTGEAFLLARNVDGVPQLWRSDGTSPGTVRLTAFQGSRAFGLSLGIPLGGDFLFTADDGARGAELWRTDGTPQGTRLFLDINLEDLGGSYPTALRAAAGKVWFFADDGANGAELWASDGTEEGTVLVHEFFPGEAPAFPPLSESSADSAGRLYFVVNLGELNFSLWRSEGAPGTTLRLSPPDVQMTFFEHLRAVGDLVFFVASDSTHGEELWVSDGTTEGTRLLADLEPGLEGSQPRSLTLFQGRLYFTARVGEAGRELWTSDGTTAGTFLVKDLDPRPNRGSEPNNLTLHAGRLLFSAADEEHGLELWSTDGTAEGTKLDADLQPGPDGFLITHLISAGTHLYFSGGPPNLAEQGLWISDGTAEGSRLAHSALIQIDSRLVATPGLLNGQIFFAKTGDQVLWTSDGTEEGTFPLRTAAGMEICEPESFQLFGGLLLFSAEGELYTSDGTQEGTHKILGLAAPNEVEVFELVHAGPRLLFRKWDRFTGSELWALEED